MRTSTILRAIDDTSLKMERIAFYYVEGLRTAEEVDWNTVDKAIVNRWSNRGYVRLQDMVSKKMR